MLKKAVVFLLFFACVFMTACDKKPEGDSGFDLNDVEIWTATSAEKIRREDMSYPLKKGAELNFECVRGETESVQLMLTPKAEISSYKLVARDIGDGNGNKIKADAFEIYVESYFTVSQRSNNSTLYPAGDYPDALIPMKLSEKAKENRIDKDRNQGIWVLVKTAEDTVAGNYGGFFRLEINGREKDIPVNVVVRDLTMPKRATMGTVFLNRRNNIQMGEHNGTTDLMVRYFEQMLDYRIMLCDVPVYNGDPSGFADFIDAHFDNPNFNTYVLPFRQCPGKSDVIGQYPTIDTDFLKAHLKELAVRSTNGRNLVKNAMLYLYSITDEPEMNGSEYIVCEIQKDIKKAVDGAVKDLKRMDPDYFTGKEEVEESIYNLHNIITGSVESEIMRGSVNTYCPMIQYFHTEEQRQNINDVCRQYGCDQVWWYTCIAPRNPYCTYHIDDNLLGSRILSWMQADYGITGNLYFDVSSYGLSSKYDNQIILPCNQYKDPLRWDSPQAVNGDGYLVYPGSRYDYYGFIPSIRLMSIRDGIEEFELLKKLENDYMNLSEYYGTDIDFHQILRNMYQKLYTGTIPVTDTGLFNEVRRELIADLAEANEPSRFLIKEIKTIGSVTSVTMLLSKDFELKINGEVPDGHTESGKGFMYNLEIDTTKGDNWLGIEITDKNDKTNVTKINKRISGRTVLLNPFDKEQRGISVSESSTYSLINHDAIENGCLEAKIKSVIKEDEAFNQLFVPELIMRDVDFLSEVNFGDLETLEFDIKNTDETDFSLKVALTCGNQSYDIGTFVIRHGRYNHVRIDVSQVAWSKLALADGVKFAFKNGGSALEPKEYNFRLDNLYVTYGGGK